MHLLALMYTTYFSVPSTALVSTCRNPHRLLQQAAPAHQVDTVDTPAAAPDFAQRPEVQVARILAGSAVAEADIHTGSVAVLGHMGRTVVAGRAAVVAGK